MTKRTIPLLLLLILFVSLFASCTPKDDVQPQTGQRTYADFTGKTIGVQTGENYNTVARDLLGAGSVPEYISIADLLESLRAGRIDACLTDSSYIQPLIDSGAYPEFEYIWVPNEVYVNKSASIFYTKELCDTYNEWLAGIIADGTMAEIQKRWLGESLPSEDDVPKFESSGENGVLRVCDTGTFPPFTYFDSKNQPTGMDYEVISRFAQHLGMTLDTTMMEYGAIGPYVISGKADMSACYLTVTEEREQSMIFGDPVTSTQGVLIVSKVGTTDQTDAPKDYTSFSGKDIAVITGVLTYNTTQKIGGKPIEYNDSASAAEDVRQGRVAGYMHALTAVRVMAAQMDGFEVIPVPKEIFAAQVAGISHDQAMIDRFNTFLAAAQADGTLADMQSRWFDDGIDLDAPIPEIENTGANGVLSVAICSDSIPYVYVGANGQYSGFSVELALRFGAYEGKTVEFADMEFGGLIAYIVGKKADIGLANMAITEERRQSVLFTEPFFDEQHGILALKKDGETSASSSGTLDYTDFFEKTLGIPNGYVLDTMIQDDFNSKVAFYSETSAGIEDVRQGRIAGFMTDYSISRVIVNQPGNDDLATVPVPETLFSGPLGAVSVNQDMINRFNSFLAGLEADGTLQEMRRYWIEEKPGSDPPMPDIPQTGENGVLKVAIGSGSVPFCYIGNDGEIKGYCAELILRFAAHEGLDAQFTTMEFSALLPYITSGKADIGIDSITITEERKKSVLFTEPFYFDLIGIIVLKSGNDAAVKSGFNFIEWLRTGIESNLITDNRWKMIVNGLGVTMTIALLAQIFGTVFGAFVCYTLMRKNKLVNGIGRFYCGLIHGTPIVVLLMITYYIIFGNTQISNVLIAVAAFTMVTGAGVAGTLKGAIDTVDPVEIEAARSIGFTAFKAFATVTLPQAVRRALPGYMNGFVELVKATAVVGYIAIQDLTRAGDIIRSRTYDAYFPLLFVALIYLIVTTVCVQLFKFIIKRINGETDSIRRRQTFGRTALDYRTIRTKTGGDLIESISEVKKGDSQ